MMTTKIKTPNIKEEKVTMPEFSMKLIFVRSPRSFTRKLYERIANPTIKIHPRTLVKIEFGTFQKKIANTTIFTRSSRINSKAIIANMV